MILNDELEKVWPLFIVSTFGSNSLLAADCYCFVERETTETTENTEYAEKGLHVGRKPLFQFRSLRSLQFTVPGSVATFPCSSE